MIRRFERHPVQVSWAASGTINLELSPKPFTITRMAIIARPSVTTTTATNFNDYWDRGIANLSLTGNGKTFVDFRNLRAAHHFARLAGFGMHRPPVVADSATTLVQQFGYMWHFGLNPANPWDLTAGIPPVDSGNLTLQGAFAAAAAMGTNTTITDMDLDVYLWGVQPEAGDAPASYLPQAFPAWTMRTPTPAATSSAFATQDNIPAGDFLHDMLVMLTNGSNSPRDDSVLNSIQVYNQLDNRTIISYGGQAGAVLDYKAAEILSQYGRVMPLSDDVSTAMTAATGTAGSANINADGANSGLIWLPVADFAVRGHPVYGVDMRRVATGDLQLRYGVSDATGVTMDVVYRKYSLNPSHPANAGW